MQTVSDYGARVGHSALHPLITFIDLSQCNYTPGARALALRFGFYAVFLKQGTDCTIKYGRKNYDYQEGTLVFMAPEQVVDISNDGPDYQPSGLVLLFHPDILKGTSLHANMHEYSFFSYQVSEALHLSEKERTIITDCFYKIEFELGQGVDKHSKRLLVSNLELMLNYCSRFYDRQFITRDNENHGVIERFEAQMDEYFIKGKAEKEGVPTVSVFADNLHLSANYFGDLIKKETGKTAQEHIQDKLIEVAKNKIYDPEKTVSQIAYELGFKYPQHFTRLFKKKTGHSPNTFRTFLN